MSEAMTAKSDLFLSACPEEADCCSMGERSLRLSDGMFGWARERRDSTVAKNSEVRSM